MGESCGDKRNIQVDNYIENNIIRFIRLLRQNGIRVSSGEALDAIKAVSYMGIEDKNAVKSALKSTLVKKAEEQKTFDRSFNLFFVPPEARKERQVEWQEKKDTFQKKMEQTKEDLNFMGETLDLDEKEMTVYASLPDKEKEKIKDYMKKTTSGRNVEEQFRPLLETVVKGSLSYWRNHLKEEMDLRKQEDSGDDDLDSISSQVDGAGHGSGGSLLYEDMEHIADKDLPKAQMMIKKMASQLVDNISRRYRLSKKNRKMDVRRTIRDNIRYGGTPFKLRYRSRRVQKPRIVLLCDVSGSMSRYASFVLQFIYSVNRVVSQIESFVFADNLERITPYFSEKQDFDATMLELVNTSKEWGGGTSVSAALKTLRKEHYDSISSNSIVLIVSDARTVAIDEALKELSSLKRTVKEVVWLNTLPQEDWEGNNVINTFAKTVKMYPCNTLANLEQIVRNKVLK